MGALRGYNERNCATHFFVRSENKLNRHLIIGSSLAVAIVLVGCGQSDSSKNGGMPSPATNSSSSTTDAPKAAKPDAPAETPANEASKPTDPAAKQAEPVKDPTQKAPVPEGTDETTSARVKDEVQKKAALQPGNERQRVVEGAPAVRVAPSGDHTKYVGKYEWRDARFDKINADIKKKGKGFPIVSYLEVRSDGTYKWSFGPANKMSEIEGTCESTPAKITLHPYIDAKTKQPVTFENEKKLWNLEFSADGKSLDTLYKLGNNKKLMKYFKVN
jgi:hypothetical protein